MPTLNFLVLSGKAIDKVTAEGRRSSVWPGKCCEKLVKWKWNRNDVLSWYLLNIHVRYMFYIIICMWLCERQTFNCLASPHEHLRKFSRLKCCSNTRHCSMKELLGERPAHIPKKAFQLQSRAGVFTLRAGTGSALGVSSRSVALQRRPFHSHRGVFVLLHEAIQLPHRARIILRPRAEWRARCVPPARPDSPPFLCAQPIPPVPSFPPHPHPHPPPRLREAAPMGTSSLWGPAHPSVSPLLP